MPFSIKRFADQGLTMITATGEIVPGESLSAVKTFYDGKPTPNVIWDFREVAMSRISEDEIGQLFDYSMKNLLKRQGGKTALVAPEERDYELARSTSTIGDLTDVPWEMQAFRTMEEAARWIGVPVPREQG
jgi:hypothetical protein